MATIADAAVRACWLSRNDPKVEEEYDDAVAYVIDAQKYVCGRSDPWDFIQMSGVINTVAGADVYPLSEIADAFQVTGIKRVLSIVDDRDGRPLRAMHWQVLERQVGSSQANGTGSPSIWCPIGTQAIRLYPAPSGGQRLGMLVERLIGQVEPTSEMIVPDAFALPVCATWAAARLWEQHAGVEARLMADRLDRRHTEALTEMIRTHGTVRWPYLTLIEPSEAVSPQIYIGGF